MGRSGGGGGVEGKIGSKSDSGSGKLKISGIMVEVGELKEKSGVLKVRVEGKIGSNGGEELREKSGVMVVMGS